MSDRIAQLEAALTAALSTNKAGAPIFKDADVAIRPFSPLSAEQETEYGTYLQDVSVAASRVGGKAIVQYAKDNADVGHSEISFKAGLFEHGVSFARPTVKDGETASKDQVRDGLGIHMKVTLSDTLKTVADDLSGMW